MNEVEKMYENCKIKKQYCGWLDMGDLDAQYTYVRCDSLEEFNDTAMMSRTSYSSEEEDWDKPSIEYPPFTAEKQIELIEWLGELQIDTRKGYWHLAKFGRTTKTVYANNGNLGEALSEIVNQLWKNLTEEKQKQVKNILESEVLE